MAGVPGGVVHEGSREFLVREGLPAAGAFLDFGALDGGSLSAFPTAGAERLFVLGETDYCTPFAAVGNLVLLDGTTGEVFLGNGGPRRDPLASGLAALAALVREVDAVGEAARRPEALDGRRGPTVVAEVMAGAERRMREIDPRLFEGDAPPAHWGTALLVRALGWGALPGGPDGPAYQVGAELVAELAALTDEDGGAGRVHRFRPEELPAVLVHEPTRRLLTEVGLPLGGAMFGVCEEPLVTMAEAYPEYFDGEEERPYQRDFLALGDWPTDLPIALDGTTGRLELPDWYDDGQPEAYLNRDLSALLYALWTYERLRAEWDRWDYGRGWETWAVFDPQSLLSTVVDRLVEGVDPEAFASPGRSWRLLAEDGHLGGLLG
ncbi:SUKH-4 family immunity protein [Kitasatospora cathayae]|uniref:SUKH-4 family immunity protein n=1 Tax=Kitasatospora cathayae TaxID=3004092 RepID=A0ABY7QAA8_9ACTN|nr:SUKH-4 family immunity protein [Kitasatospora sp. HUAS 3-15]WBP89683.1 SUKH-4 family immunity protein [Kitasatospora sp. HUAS 3-15]